MNSPHTCYRDVSVAFGGCFRNRLDLTTAITPYNTEHALGTPGRVRSHNMAKLHQMKECSSPPKAFFSSQVYAISRRRHRTHQLRAGAGQSVFSVIS